MTNNRLTIEDLMQDEFYQMPKAMILNKKYREEVSRDAKFLYMLIRDRFSLSTYTTKEAIRTGKKKSFLDKNGHLYCVLDNAEIEFTIHANNKQIKRWMDELIQADLIEVESEKGKAHRIYCKNPVSKESDFYEFVGEKNYHKHVVARKRKKQEPTTTLEEFIAKARRDAGLEEVSQSDLPTKNEGVGETDLPGVSQPDLPSEVESTYPGKSNRPTNELELKDLEANELEANDIESSSKAEVVEKATKKLEEEKQSKAVVDGNYGNLEEMLRVLDFDVDQKGLNVIKKTLMENKIEKVGTSDVAYAVVTHRLNTQAYKEKGESVRYEPAFFANNLVDRINWRLKEKSMAAKNEQSEQGSGLPEEGAPKSVKLYNWLEEA